ncbi:MAG: hypothetical protein H0W61_04945 [Bacteroidetes bacterium]|nr:hypothetical protein [Bacteroidota bacterium]
MRITFKIITFLILAGCSGSDVKKHLVGPHWFVRAENWETERRAVFTTDSTHKHEWEAIFYPSGRMMYASSFPVNFHDAKGILHLKGERFTDSLYTYQFNNNVVKVTKGEEIYFLKFESKEGGTFDITPAIQADFE